uniref:CHK kinase-like domain-containing protein n=1 Tax=Panagrolaimus superbus TaxID=310955 RepID=A0A914Y2Z6_9BILA
MKNSKIGESIFTIDFLLEKLCAKGEKNCTIENLLEFDAEDITGGVAFFSIIYSVKFKWKTPASLNSIIVKVPKLQGALTHIKNALKDESSNEGLKEKFEEHLEKSHKVEEEVYTFFSRKKDISLKLPNFYYSQPYSRYNNNGVLIIEDFTPHATPIKLIPGFSNEQVEAVIDELAKLQAISLKDRSWVEILGKDMPKSDTLDDFIPVIKKLVEIDEIKFKDSIPKLLNLAHLCTDFSFYTKEKYGFMPFLVHGDLWSSNVLWKFDEHNKATNELVAIIDWQMSRPGNPGVDFGRLLAVNTSTEYRRKNTERLLQRYLKKLEENLGEKPPVTFEQVLKNFCLNAYKQ